MAYNVDKMMYTGVAPWWLNLDPDRATKVEGEAATAAQALSLGGLDYTVEKRKLKTVDGLDVPNHFAVVRTDRDIALGVVKSRYTCVQNYDCFGFFDAIVGENEAIYHTVGALGQGERIWIMAKLPEDIVVKDRDVANMYLLLASSHDGSKPIYAKFTPIRVVCQNTLTAALAGKKEIVIRHTKNADQKLKEAHKVMGIVKKQIEASKVNFNKMADKVVTNDALEEFMKKVFPENPDAKKGTRRQNMINDVTKLYRTGKGNVGHSVWDLYNGVTEYVDHHRNVQSKTNRWENGLFGSGSDVKERAMNTALAMIEA